MATIQFVKSRRVFIRNFWTIWKIINREIITFIVEILAAIGFFLSLIIYWLRTGDISLDDWNSIGTALIEVRPFYNGLTVLIIVGVICRSIQFLMRGR